MHSLVRISLWVSGPLNLIAGAAFAFPSSALGELIRLPAGAHPLYALLSGALVALFGLAYLWLAARPQIVAPVLLLGAVGKTCAVAIVLWLYSQNQLSGVTTVLVSGDLAFAVVWFRWLWTQKSSAVS